MKDIHLSTTNMNGVTMISTQEGSNCKYLDMTASICFTPTAPDITAALVKTLELHGCFEGEQEIMYRMEILARLNHLVKQWIKNISTERHISASLANRDSKHVFIFGSCRLGVQSKDADIDALCIVPRHIHREDIFGSFLNTLKQQSDIAELRAIHNAFVPVIRMDFNTIDIDMTFARLALEMPDTQTLSDPMLLRNLDQKCVRSLNGCRVSDEILNQVPNKDTFRLTLSAIKLWAKNHGIYSNVLGYLGGVSWAMLVARACQLYPHRNSSTLIHKFSYSF